MQSQIYEKKAGIKYENGKINGAKALLLSLFVTVGATFIPISLFSDIFISFPYAFSAASIALAIIGITLCVMLTASIKPLVPFCIIAAVIILPGGGMGAASVIPVFFVTACIFAYLLKEIASPFLFAIGIVAYGASFLLTGDLFASLLSLLFIPVSLALYLSFNSGKQRVASVCRITLSIGIPLVIFSLSWIFITDGAFGLDTLKNFFTELRAGLISAISEELVDAYALYMEEAISIVDATALTTTVVSALFNIFPAVFTVILFIVSFLMHSLYISLIAPIVEDKKELQNAITFRMSIFSAIIFLIAFIASLIIKDGTALAVTQNLYIIFYPGLTLTAFAFTSSMTKGQNASCLGHLSYMMMFALLLWMPDILFPVASVAGAIIVIITEIKALKPHRENGSSDK